jgi:p-aminobenzoyl-glutamate transporter AbgT
MGFLYLLGEMLFYTLRPLAGIAAIAAGVVIGMVAALFLYDRMTGRVVERADQDVTQAEVGPSNVYYLTPELEAAHRDRRVMRLLDRSCQADAHF